MTSQTTAISSTAIKNSLSTNLVHISGTSAHPVILKPTGNKITRSTVKGAVKDLKVDKRIKLEALIQRIDQIQIEPEEDFIKESRSLLSQIMPEIQGLEEQFLLWIRFLDIADAYRMKKATSQEKEDFKRRIKVIITRVLPDQQIQSLDWRIARKILSLQDSFSLTLSDLKLFEEGVLQVFKAEIDFALEYLLWQKEESLFVDSTKTILTSLHQYFNSPTQKDLLLEALLLGRFDKDKFDLKNSLVIGEDGGLYLLLNRLNQQQQLALISEQIVTKDYLTDKIIAKEKKDEGKEGKDDKIVLGSGGFGTVRFALSLLRSRSLPAEIVCVKKTKSFTDLQSRNGFKPSPLEQATETTLGDYFTNDRAHAIYSPCILDLGFVTDRNMVKDEKDHRKGYLMMEILPQNTATRVFAHKKYQKWEYQKSYLLDVLENTQQLLNLNIAMTDLKPDNTLYDTDTRKATIIDLGGSIKVTSSQELLKFDITKYSFQITKGFQAPELSGRKGVVNMHNSLAFSCGKVIEAITHKSDFAKKSISQIVNELTAPEPEKRLSIPEAIEKIKQMSDDSSKKNIIFSHYIKKVKDRLQNRKAAISINEDIERTTELLITLNTTPLDPSKYTSQKIEDLFKKIDNFFASGNAKQVMAIFGVAGSGKSIALQLKFIEAVNAWKPGRPLPIYFNLANGLDLAQVVRTLNTELGTNLNMKDLDRPHLYIDSFDEGLGIESRRETLIKEYFRQLGSAKILITCRTDYLQDSSYDWFIPESKKFEVCYVAPINYNGHKNLPNMVKRYVGYSKKHNSTQNTAQDYLEMLKELQLTDFINTGFIFFLVMEVLFKLQDKTEQRVINKMDIYASYINHYQESQIAKLKNSDQKKRLTIMSQSMQSSQLDTNNLGSLATELGKYLASQMHLMGQSRLSESHTLFTELGYDNSYLLKHQSIFHMLRLLPLKIVTTHSGNRFISNQEIKVGFIHEIIKNYYLVEAIISEVEREGKSQILASNSIVHDRELVKLIVLAMKDNPSLTDSFLKAIENSKEDKSEPSITYASNSITLLVAAKHSFSGCDLSNITVRGANIVNGIFFNANLERADLTDVNMSHVNLMGASLNGADMKGVNFSIFPDLVEHTYFVYSVSFSPDGKSLASGSRDKTIKIWNPSTGKCQHTLNGHTESVNSVSFSPDGKFLGSGSYDKTIKIWNPSTGKCLGTLNGHTHPVRSVSFSPDGKFLASGSADKTIKIWNPTTGVCLHTLNGHTSEVCTVSFSPDGKLLASGEGLFDKAIKLWDLSTGKCLKTLKGHTTHVYSVSFSPDGKFLVSGSYDRTIKIWNPSTGECMHTLNGHTHGVNSVSFSPDGKFLVSGSEDKTIKIWDPTTGECLHTLNGHTESANSVSFSPDGKFLASGSSDKTIKIWNSSIGDSLQTLYGHTNSVIGVSFSPNGKSLVSRSYDKTIKIWNPSTFDCLQTLYGHTESADSVSFSPDGKFLASGSDKTIKIWNPSTGKCLRTLNGHDRYISSVSFSPDGKFLASGSSYDKILKIWNPSTGKCLHTEYRYADCVRFSDGNPSTNEWLQTFYRHIYYSVDKYFGSVKLEQDNTIKIIKPSTGECLHTLNGHTDKVNSASFSPDGKFLISRSEDKTIKIWDPTTGECLHTLNVHNEYVFDISFSPDGKFRVPVIGLSDKTIKIFESVASTNTLILKHHISATPSPLVASGATLENAIISPNNRLILTQKGAMSPTSTVTPPHIVLESDISRLNNLDNPGSNNFENPTPNDYSQPFATPPSVSQPAEVVRNNPKSNCCQIFVMSRVVYDNPLLNFPALYTQISQTLGPVQALKLSNIEAAVASSLNMDGGL